MSGQTDEQLASSRILERPPVPVVPAQATGPSPSTSQPAPQPASQPGPAPDVEPAPPPAAPPAPATAAGSKLASRYLLGVRVGSDVGAGAEFWRADDTVLRRPVAVTLLRRLPGESGSDAHDAAGELAGEIIVRALRSGSFEHPGCARLLDVLAPGAPGVPHDVIGAAVTEWVPGRSLAEFLADGLITPIAAARAVQQLAAAAEAAHRHGHVLGCDHPQRVRITPEGRAQLCFSLPRPDLRPADDVRGLGAVLYALLTSRWPLSGADAARAGLAAAERGADGAPVPVSASRPGIPVELEALVTGTLGPDDAPGRVHTAAAVRRIVDEVVEEADRLALFPPARDGAPSRPGDVWQEGDRGPRPDPRRRRKLIAGLAVLGLGVVAVLGYAAVEVSSLFRNPESPTIVVAGGIPPSSSDEQGGDAAQAQAADAPVRVVGAEVYTVTGDSDNAERVSRLIDGDAGSGWRTSTYRQQFPGLKPGIGVMTSFASPVQLSSVMIDSPSPGTELEIRSAPSPDAEFGETVPITTATLADGRTQVSLAESQPVQYVLVWITKLGGGGGEHATEIRELEFRRVAD